MSLRQLLGTSARSIPALREPNSAARERYLASREPIGALREPAIRCRQRYLLRVQRGQGRAVGAAEDHMVCLELF